MVEHAIAVALGIFLVLCIVGIIIGLTIALDQIGNWVERINRHLDESDRTRKDKQP